MVAALLASPQVASGQVPLSTTEAYRVACAPCHADDGSGSVPERTFKTAPMNFADCGIASREPDADWELVIERGGPAAGLSWDMPSFGDAFTREQIAALARHLRTFCGDPQWPHGNLNFPRPLLTKKAYPEDEVVITPVISHHRFRYTRGSVEAAYERRVGRRGQVEIELPFHAAGSVGGLVSGVGDVALGAKYVLHADRAGTRILSAGIEVSAPTGNRTLSFGQGTPVFEPYLAAGAVWRGMYLQMAFKGHVPVKTIQGEDDRHVVYDVYAGRDVGRLASWTVGVELNGSDGVVAVTPQVRKTLTRTGALAVAGGVRLPVVSGLEPQFTRWIAYLLWDYRDPVRAR